MCRHLNLAMIALTSLCHAAGAADEPFLHAPSVDTYARHDPVGRTILSNGRFLQPVGKHLAVGRFPYGLAMSRDGKTLFVASSGVGQLIFDWRSAKPAIAVVTPPLHQGRRGRRGRPTNSGGADFSPDGRRLYWSAGE